MELTPKANILTGIITGGIAQMITSDDDTGKKEEHDIIVALGYGGQYIMIIWDFNLVVITTSLNSGNENIAHSKIPMVIDEILPLF